MSIATRPERITDSSSLVPNEEPVGPGAFGFSRGPGSIVAGDPSAWREALGPDAVKRYTEVSCLGCHRRLRSTIAIRRRYGRRCWKRIRSEK